MYLTAQRVTNTADGTTGVNSFKHRHNRALGVEGSWGTSEVKAIANQRPGELSSKEIQLKPGGNQVLSYLDVICEDDTPASVIEEALLEFGPLVPQQFGLNRNGVVLLFSTVQGISGHEELEFTVLSEAISKLLYS